jgi:NitT/TauT family transport system substrate-binding protein
MRPGPRLLPLLLALLPVLLPVLPATAAEDPPPGAVPRLEPPGTFEPKDGVLEIELSEYAGYAGLVLANGGLEPRPDSLLAAKCGMPVRIRLSEEESWSALSAGRMAASATTVDVLAVYGDQMDVVLPAQVGWSRGADAVVVRAGIRSLGELRGGVVAAARFTESDFFLRTLAAEAGIPVAVLPSPDAPPRSDAVNLLYLPDNEAAADRFLEDLGAGKGRLAGCVTWEPKVGEVLEGGGKRVRVLARNLNLLLVADVLLVNGGFARARPEVVAGLVEGLLEGNRRVREEREKHLPVVAAAFGWEPEEARANLGRVHLSNLPENIAFFSGAVDAGGSFGMLYQSAVLAYGPALLPRPAPEDRFPSLDALRALEKSGAFRGQRADIAPVRTAPLSLEGEPLLRKDVRFLFERGGNAVDPAFGGQNQAAVAEILRLLRIGRGSLVRVRGFVDNAEWEAAKKAGTTPFRSFQEFAASLSLGRAERVRTLLAAKGVERERILAVGTSWVQNVGSAVPQNRRVEAEWFPVE